MTAVMHIKVMKRLLSIIFTAIFLLSLCACAPNNIIGPVTPPEENVPNETPGSEQTEIPSQEETPTPTGNDGVITDNRKENEGVKPSFDIDEQKTLTSGTEILKGKTLNMYITEDGAFKAGKMNESEWLSALADEYGVNIRATVRSKETLYSAQSIAIKSGRKLDIITADMNDLASSLSLMKSSTQYVSENAVLPFSKSVFEKTDGKVFTARGNTRMLWYNKNIITNDSPYMLTEQNNWTSAVFEASALSTKSESVKFIECDNWISFGSAGGETVTGITPDGFTFSVTGEKSIAAFTEFARITQIPDELNTEDYGWLKGNTAFIYTDTPEKKGFEVSFAPIPSVADGNAVAEYTGVGIGVSKTADDETARASAVFAALWSARATESRVDELLFDVGLGSDKAKKYLEYSESFGLMCNVDAVIGKLFESESIPTALYGEPETVYNSFYNGYNRAKIIKERY